jgi:hypothetical protein
MTTKEKSIVNMKIIYLNRDSNQKSARYFIIFRSGSSRFDFRFDEIMKQVIRLPVCGLHNSILISCALGMYEIRFFKLIQTILAFIDPKLEIVYHWLKEKVNSSKRQFYGSKDLILKMIKFLLEMLKSESKLLGHKR